MSAVTSWMFTKLRSSFTQKPERNSRATIELVALSRRLLAASSVKGVTNSPTARVAAATTRPAPDDVPRELAHRQPRGAHHRELGLVRHPRQGEERADEGRGGQQDVRVRGQRQEHVADHDAEAVAAPPHVVQLAHEVEEAEQRQQRREHQQARGEDLPGEVAEEHRLRG